jgi:hypothetical protein
LAKTDSHLTIYSLLTFTLPKENYAVLKQRKAPSTAIFSRNSDRIHIGDRTFQPEVVFANPAARNRRFGNLPGTAIARSDASKS